MVNQIPLEIKFPAHTQTQLDGILIETTGVADPGPVVQTFYTEQFDRETAFLDGVITVADAKFVSKHLDEKVRMCSTVCEKCVCRGCNLHAHHQKGIEAMKQIAYADRIILNKIGIRVMPIFCLLSLSFASLL